MEEDIELDETILFMKSKLTRSTHASGKRRKLMPSILNSSIVNDKMVQISQTKSDDISAVSKVHFQPETDNPLEEIEPISLRSSQHLGSAESACHVDKEIYKAWFFDGSDNENPASSSFAFINKCGFDSESSGDMLEKAGGKELASEHADSSSSNVKKSCTSNIKEGCQIPHDGTISAETRHQLNSSTQSESIFPNMELITKSKKYENLANGDFEHEHHELLSEESVTCDDALHDLDASVCSGNCAEVDSEGILPSIVNGVILDNEKTNSSEAVVGKKMISCAPELNTSSSCDIINRSKADSDTALRMESLNTSLYALKQDNQCKSCNLGSIDSNKSLETCGSCNHVVHGNHGELVRESMQPLTTCILNNDALVDYNTLDSDTLESNGAAPPDNLPSREGHMLNSFLAKQTFSDVDDAARLTGQFVWHFPLSQLHESEANNLDNVVDASLKCPSSFAEENQDNIGHFVTGSSLDTTEVNGGKTMLNKHMVVESNSDDNQYMVVEPPPQKLPSNRKEISPNSQEKLWALNGGGLDEVHLLSGDEEALLETEQIIMKPKIMNESLPHFDKGIPNSSYTICSNPCCSKKSNNRLNHDAILFSQRQMHDTEKIATKLLKGLNSLKSIVQEALFSETHSSPLNFTAEEELDENKVPSSVADLHKGRKKITFADEAGGMLCQVKVYEHQPVAFIEPKTLAYSMLTSRKALWSPKACFKCDY
ncbi:hypothetical protein HPP92_021280 [Vanilla planifolia]|uniref:Uncharacterized protein n=1 Tax=Vanilla planifolia TaxID=51239 RepID=A0A835Q1N5_VANPL|nr:hypothetical protein HPP92_021280 [Vanilla planifolia]